MYEGIPGTSPEFLELAKNSGNLIRIFKTTSMPTTAAAARHAWSESSEAQNGHGVVDTCSFQVFAYISGQRPVIKLIPKSESVPNLIPIGCVILGFSELTGGVNLTYDRY
jgi:hypothetical protein